MRYVNMRAVTVSSLLVASMATGGMLDSFKKQDNDSEKVTPEEAVQKAAPKGAGNLRYSISVSDIEKSYSAVVKWDLADAFKLMLTDALQSSGHFIVLGEESMRDAAMREQDLVASGRTAQGKKAPKIGRMTPAQILVRGAITACSQDTSGAGGGLSFKGISVGGSGGSAEVNMTIYLVDTETGQVKASQSIVGVSKKKGLSLGYSGSLLGGLGGNFAGFEKDNVGKATANAVSQAVEYLVAQLEDIAWEGSVALVKGTTIICNKGTREGVELGMEFTVGETEELVDEDTGEVLDVDMTQIGTLKVTKVKEKVCYCEITSGEGIQKGMTIFLKQ